MEYLLAKSGCFHTQSVAADSQRLHLCTDFDLGARDSCPSQESRVLHAVERWHGQVELYRQIRPDVCRYWRSDHAIGTRCAVLLVLARSPRAET